CLFIFIFFLFMLNCSLRSSILFPYTTLFRSAENFEIAVFVRHREERMLHHSHVSKHPGMHITLEAHHYLRAGETSSAYLTFAHLDRKSTRLNSSHRTISYAVFCLKKKTIPIF